MTANKCSLTKTYAHLLALTDNVANYTITQPRPYFKDHHLYACSACYKTFASEPELEHHHHYESENLRLRKRLWFAFDITPSNLLFLNQGPYKCHYCVTTWPSEKARNAHEIAGHRSDSDVRDKTIICPHCQKSYYHKSSLSRHICHEHRLTCMIVKK